MMPKKRNTLTALSALMVLAGILAIFALAPSRSPAESTPQTDAPAATSTPPLDLNALLSPRSIGAPDAPVTIVENSSLSCPHCAHFHKEILPQLKKDYVETGKVRLIMNDFPLNRPALEGLLLARCLPEDRFFDFMDLLFSTQETWVKDPAILQQNAKLAGLSPERVAQCLNSEDLAKGIMDNMQAAQKKWKVDSTPTFVFNDGASTLIGALPYDDFKAEIEKLLKSETPPVLLKK